jgi:hypothetical protein
MIRMDAYWTGHPLDRTRSSHLALLPVIQGERGGVIAGERG